MIEVAFMHIPKTAGVSVAKGIRNAFSGRKILDKDLDQRLFGSFSEWNGMAPALRDRILFEAEIPKHMNEKYEVAMGHFCLDTLLRCHAKIIVTVLREPRVRILSYYLYLRSWTEEMHRAFGTYDHTVKA